jgi:nucleotide-binding universal stress UspA family protein
MFKKILVPIDLAEPTLAELGVRLAAEFAALVLGEVRIVHVVPDLPYGLGVFLPPNLSTDIQASTRSRLREMAASAGIPAGRSSYTVRNGVAYNEVLAETRAWDADLVIVGSHDLSKASYLLGSNAEKIVRHAECSVLVVRAHKDREGAYWLVPPIAS